MSCGDVANSRSLKYVLISAGGPLGGKVGPARQIGALQPGGENSRRFGGLEITLGAVLAWGISIGENGRMLLVCEKIAHRDTYSSKKRR